MDKGKPPDPEEQQMGGASNMFDLLKLPQAVQRDEHIDVESGLSRFKKETGVDFFDLVNDKQLRVKCLVDSVDNHDTDEDEEINQEIYGSLQHRLVDDKNGE